MTSDPKRDERSIDTAKQKLTEIVGRPIDVDVTLAKDRARQERQTAVEREAAATLAHVRSEARDRRHTMRAEKILAESETQREKRNRFEEDKRAFERRRPSTAKEESHE